MFTDDFFATKWQSKLTPSYKMVSRFWSTRIRSHPLAWVWPLQNGGDWGWLSNEFSQDPWTTTQNSPADPTTFPSRLWFFLFLSLLLFRAQAFRRFFAWCFLSGQTHHCYDVPINLKHNIRPSLTSPDSRSSIPDSRFSILDSRSLIPDSRFSILDSRSLILDSRFSILDSRSLILDFRSQPKWRIMAHSCGYPFNIHSYFEIS